MTDLIQTFAVWSGICGICDDPVSPGDLILAGDQDEPYAHIECAEREAER